MNATTIVLNPNVKSLSNEQLADELGDLRAALQPLLECQKEIETRLKISGKKEVNGLRYRVTVSISNRATTAWKKIAMALKPSPQRIASNTSHSSVTSLRVKALPKS